MKKVLMLGMILWGGLCVAGQFPRTGVLPEQITTEDSVRIGIAANIPPCLGSSNVYPTFYHLSESNYITFVFVAYGYEPCSYVEDFTLYYDIGTLPAGDYTMQVYTVNGPLDVPITIDDFLGFPLGEEVRFSVQGVAEAMPVPFMAGWAIGLLILAMLLSVFVVRKKLVLLSIFAILISANVSAKQFVLLLSNEPGVPTAEQVVNQASTAPPPDIYLLDTFNEYTPSAVGYLLFQRPYGQRLELIEQYPEWTLSKLYRYLLVTYPEEILTTDLLTSFNNDAYIISASDINQIEGVISSPLETATPHKADNNILSSFIGSFISDLDISLAWDLSEGMGYIGIIDSGTDVNHPALKPFSENNQYLGGNLLDDHYQIDLASGDFNVDEAEPIDTQGNSYWESCDLADGVNDNLASSVIVGHGTHVSGIIAAKDESSPGICKNCGLGVMKWTTFASCSDLVNPPSMTQTVDKAVIPQIFEVLATSGGYGTVNWSGGIVENNNSYTEIINDEFFCDDLNNQQFCEVLQLFRENNVLMVSSGGNNRVKIQFPASETETVAVGGLDQTGVYWNESPGPNGLYDLTENSNCPFNDPLNQCGSNISNPPINQKVDVVTQARSVYSTFYPGGRWNETVGCTDSSDNIDNDGYGYCTGTSMSSPQVAAILQLMRSTNPLLPNGTYDPNLNTGLINVLNSTSSRSLAGQNVNNYMGYGLPSASLAIAKILGYSNGEIMRTRLTPMFEVVSDVAKNNVYSPFPQMAFAFLVANGASYTSNANAALVSEFPTYWHGQNVVLPTPRANFYVFTTNNNPSVNLKNMVPLRRMEKTINGTNRNDTYAVSDAEIETFHNDGYNYAGIEGYIFPTCVFEPNCMPYGAHILYRVEDDVNFNHTLINLPPADPAPANSTKLGYVYPNVDTDGDGLIDGQEFILGTSHTNPDSDGDGLTDSFEYPPAGVPFSDPLISDIIFEDDFELN